MIGIIVLAAGKGERFGGDKMLAKIGSKTFIEHTIDKLLQQKDCPIVCVTSTKIKESIKPVDSVIWAINNHPEYGISYSIKCGINTVKKYNPNVRGYLFIVGDQPLLKVESLNGLIKAFQKHPDKIHCVSSHNEKGNPTIFPVIYEYELLKLEGDVGGRKIIKKHPHMTMVYEVEKQELWDLDTPQDYKAFTQGNFK